MPRRSTPHSSGNTFTNAFISNICEGLARHNAKMESEPALAERWKPVSPAVWRFHLRRNVVFHAGSAFDAGDVLFTWTRLNIQGARVRPTIDPVTGVRKVDSQMVGFETSQPFPVLLSSRTHLFVMDSLRHGQGVERADWRNLGIGSLRPAREPRRAALWRARRDGGDPDQDIPRIEQNPALQVVQGPELRAICFGFDQYRVELFGSDIKGKNPLKDRHVRQAICQAIDVEAIGAASCAASPGRRA